MAERDLKHLTAGVKALADPIHYIYPPAGFWVVEQVTCHLTSSTAGAAPTTGCALDVQQYHDTVNWVCYDATIGATVTTNTVVWYPQITLEGGRDYLCFTFGNGTATDYAAVHVWMRKVGEYR